MTRPQAKADNLLHAWQLLRLQGVPADARLPIIDALCEMERAKRETPKQELNNG